MNRTDHSLAQGDHHDGGGESSSLASVVFQTILVLTIMAVSVISNFLVFIVFYQRPALRSLSNRFVLSLVTSNFLSAVLLMPVALVSLLLQQWMFSVWWCKLSKILSALLNVACTLSLVLIALDRYFAVMSPLHYNTTMTRCRCTFMICAIWFLAAILVLLPVVGLSDKEEVLSVDSGPCNVNKNATCVESVVQNSPVNMLCGNLGMTIVVLVGSQHRCWVALALLLSGCVLPLFFLTWIYTCMYRVAHRTSARARQHSVTVNQTDMSVDVDGYASPQVNHDCQNNMIRSSPKAFANSHQAELHHQHHRKRMHRRRSSNTSLSFILFREEGKAAKTGMMVVMSFCCCWMPFFTSALWEALVEPPYRPTSYHSLIQLLAFSGCAINPFIYVYRNDIARQDARRLLRCHAGNKTILRQHHHQQHCGTDHVVEVRVRSCGRASVVDGEAVFVAPEIINDTNYLTAGPVFPSHHQTEGLVRKLSNKVCKSVSMAEDVILKGRRPSIRKSRENVEDQIKMVENPGDWSSREEDDYEEAKDQNDANDNCRSNKTRKLSNNYNTNSNNNVSGVSNYMERKLSRCRSWRLPKATSQSGSNQQEDLPSCHKNNKMLATQESLSPIDTLVDNINDVPTQRKFMNGRHAVSAISVHRVDDVAARVKNWHNNSLGDVTFTTDLLTLDTANQNNTNNPFISAASLNGGQTSKNSQQPQEPSPYLTNPLLGDYVTLVMSSPSLTGSSNVQFHNFPTEVSVDIAKSNSGTALGWQTRVVRIV